MLHVELMKNVESSDNNDKDNLEVEGDGGYNMENDGNIRDEYFDVNMEPSRVYDAATTPGHKGDVLDVPTLEERLNQKTTASAPTPKRQRSCIEVDLTGLTGPGQASPKNQRAPICLLDFRTDLTGPGQAGPENQGAPIFSLDFRTDLTGPG
ncbi:hypothetical protein TIFTF001_027850 [Ficus carica]|uniref:Uncharacterized protein n=1 Tax=Ficus carica TaxID=3494 RepID=A0AA88DNV5_FICCA|nr:hypothetical protein TIFTF001_027850 [Ficus carica]